MQVQPERCPAYHDCGFLLRSLQRPRLEPVIENQMIGLDPHPISDLWRNLVEFRRQAEIFVGLKASIRMSNHNPVLSSCLSVLLLEDRRVVGVTHPDRLPKCASKTSVRSRYSPDEK
jgi:hypothetical protein